MNLDPALLQLCAMVLVSPDANRPDIDICRLMLDDAVRAERDMSWPAALVISVAILALAQVCDQWLKGRYRRAPREPAPVLSAQSNCPRV